MGIGLTDLNRTGRMGPTEEETAYELGEPITQDFGVRIATTQHQGCSGETVSTVGGAPTSTYRS